jgi:Cu-Zn family superoxide dismutase
MKATLAAAALLAALAGSATLAVADHHEGGIKEAVAVVAPTKAGDGKAHGVVVLKQEKGYVQVTGEIFGLSPGKHGFHIHMFGDLRSGDGMSTGGHYNPGGHKHGGPHDKEHHVGDLGNIDAGEDGIAKIEAKAEGADLHMLLGRAIVVHGGTDDLKSDPAGNAGPRIAVGVIGLAEVKAPAKK